MSDLRAELQSTLYAYERLLDTMSAKYVELLEDTEAGMPAPEHKAYLTERVNYLYEQWAYTKHQLDKLPPLAKDCTLPVLVRELTEGDRELTEGDRELTEGDKDCAEESENDQE